MEAIVLHKKEDIMTIVGACMAIHNYLGTWVS